MHPIHIFGAALYFPSSGAFEGYRPDNAVGRILAEASRSCQRPDRPVVAGLLEQLMAESGTHIVSVAQAGDYGGMDELSMKVTDRTVKYVTCAIDENNYVFEIIDLHAGDDYKAVAMST